MRDVYALPVDRLSPELLSLWRELYDTSEQPVGPFLHPAYVQAVGRARPGVEVGIITHEGAVVGFLPFQRHRFDVGGSVGGRLCDLSGTLVRPGTLRDPKELSRQFGLRVLRLSNVPVCDPTLRSITDRPRPAPVIDLGRGFEHYHRTIASSSSIISQIGRRRRKLERERGTIRFEWHTDDDVVFDSLMTWKAAQREATRTPNVLELPWVRTLMDVLRRRSRGRDDFESVLSALYVDGELAAAHFGIRSRRVLHYWIPAYSDHLGKYSPGLITLMEIARCAAEHGVERIDLGPGQERYKLRASTGSLELATATTTTSPAVASLVEVADGVRSWSRRSPIGRSVRTTGRALTRATYALRSTIGGVVGNPDIAEDATFEALSRVTDGRVGG